MLDLQGDLSLRKSIVFLFLDIQVNISSAQLKLHSQSFRNVLKTIAFFKVITSGTKHRFS